jgi:hypothetical protein
MKYNLSLLSEDYGPLKMLNSGTNCGNYEPFDEDINTEVSKFLKRFLNIPTSSRTGCTVCKWNIYEYRNCEIERDFINLSPTTQIKRSCAVLNQGLAKMA